MPAKPHATPHNVGAVLLAAVLLALVAGPTASSAEDDNVLAMNGHTIRVSNRYGGPLVVTPWEGAEDLRIEPNFTVVLPDRGGPAVWQLVVVDAARRTVFEEEFDMGGPRAIVVTRAGGTVLGVEADEEEGERGNARESERERERERERDREAGR